MRRAAVRAFRTARLAQPRSLVGRSRISTFQSSHALGIRYASGRAETTTKSSTPSRVLASSKTVSSMYIRRFSVAVISGLVGYGAWYTYKGQTGDLVPSGTNPTSSAQAQQGRGFSTSGVYSAPNPSQTAVTALETERKAVIVGADSLYTDTISGEGPISKDTDASGRKVLEMLTPDQATQMLRRNEESYLVGRGNGVVRYDVVQIPSNDPIEDDHSEKIIEVPQALATATAARNPSSDWMFWGVFDGHAYV